MTLLDLVDERPFGIAIDARHIYRADLDGGRIRRANLDGNNIVTLVSGLQYPRAIVVAIPEPAAVQILIMAAFALRMRVRRR